MKLLTVFACLMGVAVALQPAARGERADSPSKRAPRSKAVGIEMRARSGLAVAEYSTSTSKPTQLHSKAGLAKVPSSQRRRQLEPEPADFFECTNPVSINLAMSCQA